MVKSSIIDQETIQLHSAINDLANFTQNRREIQNEYWQQYSELKYLLSTLKKAKQALIQNQNSNNDSLSMGKVIKSDLFHILIINF